MWASRFRGPGMATEECWGHPYTSWFIIPRLVTRPVHVLWPEDFFFFFFFFFGGPRGKVTASHEGSLPLRVPSSGCTAGWFVPAFTPAWISRSLRPLLFRPLIRVVWLFPWPLVCQLFLLFGLFTTNLIEVVVDTLEKSVELSCTASFQGWPLLVALTGRPSTYMRLSSSGLSRLHA